MEENEMIVAFSSILVMMKKLAVVGWSWQSAGLWSSSVVNRCLIKQLGSQDLFHGENAVLVGRHPASSVHLHSQGFTD
jgi:hypothetical protein